MGYAQDLETIIKCAEELKSYDIYFRFIGQGVCKPEIVHLSKHLGEKIQFHDSMKRENLIKWIIEKSSDDEELTESLIAIMGQSFVPKLKGLDAVASNKEQNTEMIRDTFLYKEWKDTPELKTINVNNNSAPMWAKDLKHKERRIK